MNHERLWKELKSDIERWIWSVDWDNPGIDKESLSLLLSEMTKREVKR